MIQKIHGRAPWRDQLLQPTEQLVIPSADRSKRTDDALQNARWRVGV